MAGFIGSHLAAALLDQRGDGRRRRLLHRLLRRGRSRKRNLDENARATGIPLRRDGDPGRGSAGAARRRDARVPPGGPGGRAQELGHGLQDLHRATTSTRRRCCSRPASAVRSSASCTRRARRSTATRAAIPMREDALPQPISPYGVTKMAAEQLGYLYHVNYGVPVVAMRYFTVYGPRQRPDMAFHRFIRAALEGRADHALRRRRADARLHVRGRRRGGDDRRRRARRAGRGLQHRRRLAGLDERRAADHRADRRPAAEDRARRRAEGRHARHLRRHVAGARGTSGSPRRSRSKKGFQAEYRWLSSLPALA